MLLFLPFLLQQQRRRLLLLLLESELTLLLRARGRGLRRLERHTLQQRAERVGLFLEQVQWHLGV